MPDIMLGSGEKDEENPQTVAALYGLIGHWKNKHVNKQ